MSSFISTHFVFDQIKSEDMGIHLIKPSGGLIEGSFWGEREIISESIQGNPTPYIYGQKIHPLRFTLHFSPMEKEWTSELKNKVSRWLNNGKFNEFYSVDDIDKRYFITYTGFSSLNQTGTAHGYIAVDFLNLDGYVRSPVYTKNFDLSAIVQSQVIELNNYGDTTIFPNMHIKKIGRGDLFISNLSDQGRTFKLIDLNDQEVIHINNKHRSIETSVPDRYIYNHFNGNYLNLVYGINRLQVTGACQLNFEYRYEFLSH